MKRTFLFILYFVLILSVKAQNTQHTVGFSTGIAFPREDAIYADYELVNIWSDNDPHLVFNLFYEYSFSDYCKLGTHLEMEKNKIELYYPLDEDISCKRVVWGIHWLAKYPNAMIHAELGGFGNVGIVSSDDWDKGNKGIEYGALVGPGMDIDQINIAIHFKPTFSYYFSDDDPESVLLMYPRVMCKFGYSF